MKHSATTPNDLQSMHFQRLPVARLAIFITLYWYVLQFFLMQFTNGETPVTKLANPPRKTKSVKPFAGLFNCEG